MRRFAIGLGLSGAICGAIGGFQGSRPTTVVITGDIMGSLEPCGCTAPQTGGIRRQASLVRQLGQSSDVMLLVNGALAGSNSRQDAMKVETLAQTYGALKAAIGLSADDARLGSGSMLAIQNLADNRLISGNLEDSGQVAINRETQRGNYLTGSASTHAELLAMRLGSRVIRSETAIQDLISDAKQQSLTPILLLDGLQEDALQIARKFPDLALIVYRSASDPPSQPVQVGQTLLVTPGERGKNVIRLSAEGRTFSGYQVIPLGPGYKDDPQISRFYQSYLKRVDGAGFIDHMPRVATDPFAGSAACAKCHASSYKVWAHSKHAGALASLETQGHARDPDCVSCHVVGLTSSFGFRSRKLTPELAAVGCESCHGPAKRHSLNPRRIKLPKLGTEMCLKCHTSDQSPNFNVKAGWDRITHR